MLLDDEAVVARVGAARLLEGEGLLALLIAETGCGAADGTRTRGLLFDREASMPLLHDGVMDGVVLGDGFEPPTSGVSYRRSGRLS